MVLCNLQGIFTCFIPFLDYGHTRMKAGITVRILLNTVLSAVLTSQPALGRGPQDGSLRTPLCYEITLLQK